MPIGPPRRIHSRDQALRAGFFISGRAIDLSGEIKPRQGANLKGRGQGTWIDIIIFDGIGVLADYDIFEPRNRPDERILHRFGQRRGNPVRIDRVILQSFGFEENLVAVTIGKPVDLVFN